MNPIHTPSARIARANEIARLGRARRSARPRSRHGAVTQPWSANVVFRPLAPDAFTTFNKPGYVKIAWTLRADATSPAESVFRSETRAVAMDRTARAKFRRYWSFLSPGIIIIRWTMLQPLKAEAERHAALTRSAGRLAPAAAESMTP